MGKFFKAIIKRMEGLLLKIIGFEGLVFAIATKAMFDKFMSPEIWLATAALAAGVKTYQAKNGLAHDIKLNQDGDK